MQENRALPSFFPQLEGNRLNRIGGLHGIATTTPACITKVHRASIWDLHLSDSSRRHSCKSQVLKNPDRGRPLHPKQGCSTVFFFVICQATIPLVSPNEETYGVGEGSRPPTFPGSSTRHGQVLNLFVDKKMTARFWLPKQKPTFGLQRRRFFVCLFDVVRCNGYESKGEMGLKDWQQNVRLHGKLQEFVECWAWFPRRAGLRISRVWKLFEFPLATNTWARWQKKERQTKKTAHVFFPRKLSWHELVLENTVFESFDLPKIQFFFTPYWK